MQFFSIWLTSFIPTLKNFFIQRFSIILYKADRRLPLHGSSDKMFYALNELNSRILSMLVLITTFFITIKVNRNLAKQKEKTIWYPRQFADHFCDFAFFVVFGSTDRLREFCRAICFNNLLFCNFDNAAVKYNDTPNDTSGSFKFFTSIKF